MHLIARYALIYLTTPTLCGHAISILQRIAAAGAGGDAIFCSIIIVSSEDTMSLKMCGLLLVIGATHGLIEGIKNRKASCAY